MTKQRAHLGRQRSRSRRPIATLASATVAVAGMLLALAVLAVPVAQAGTGPSLFDLRPTTVSGWPEAAPDDAPTLFLPPGFTATVFAHPPAPEVRTLAVSPTGLLYATHPKYGAVVALPDADGDGHADAVVDVLTGLDCPYGLAFDGDWLYVAQRRQVVRYPLAPMAPVSPGPPGPRPGDAGTSPGASPETGLVPPARGPSGGSSPGSASVAGVVAAPGGAPAPARATVPVVTGPGEVIVDGLPEAVCGPHGFRPLALDPAADALYLAVGSDCNVCVERGLGASQRAKVWRYPLHLPGPGEVVAQGLRNVPALARNPWDGQLWAVVDERDDLGDNLPPDLVTALVPGADYGWPACYLDAAGTWHPDPRVPPSNPACTGLAVPDLFVPAHTTPLGLAFHDGRGLPEAFGPSLFVALHGSWNHSAGVGYKLVRVPLNAQGQPAGLPQEFALGWLPRASNRAPDAAWGRPVNVAVGLDGALYVSDDKADLIYRITYTPAAP